MSDQDSSTERTEAETSAADAAPLIVVVGAAAASSEALGEFFKSVEANGAAYIVCLSHQEAMADAAVIAMIAEATALPVMRARKQAIEAGHVYLIPANMLATVTRDRIALRKSPEAVGLRGRIDTLMVSAAEAARERAVAVVLEGTHGDGLLGIVAIKENDGLAIVQEADPGESRGPVQVGAPALADHLLAPADMGACIVSYIDHLAQMAGMSLARGDAGDIGAELAQIVAVLRNRTGHDFHGYKRNTFLRRVQRRMLVTQRATMQAYTDYLRHHADESRSLFNDLLIGVTAFFRDPAEFDLLAREVIPKLVEGKGTGGQIRVWVLGCATGEEAYSIAMLLREEMARREITPLVQIFATDIDGRALAAAREGRYSETALQEMAPERLARWFVREGDTYCVVRELREMCIFSQHSLIKDAPFSRMDMVACRNLLIYLNTELQNRVIPLFHFALQPGGFLFLGTAENVTRHARLFAPIDNRHRIYRRQEITGRILPDFPLTLRAPSVPVSGGPMARPAGAGVPLARQAERIAQRYAPALVIVDEHDEVLHFSGAMGRYLDPVSGAASLNIVNLVQRELRVDLRTALRQVAADGRTVSIGPLRLGTPPDGALVTVTVEPVPGDTDAPRCFVAIFQGVAQVTVADGEYAADADERMLRMESELILSRERLQATVEELESTNEELKSSNEEYQSINEEMQSANEELETSREELQSVNEELQTVNGEMGHRVDELDRANSDLKNLLESTQIATLFLDNDLRVKMFTPDMARIFHLIDKDIDRPLGHITPRVPYPELEDDIRRVLRTLGAVEREIEDPQAGLRYLVRIHPYRSIDNFIGGTVLTFLDISAATRVEEALRDSEERFRSIAKSVPLLLFIGHKVLDWSYINPRFGEYTGWPEERALGEGWIAAVHPNDVEPLRIAWEQSERDGKAFEVEYRVRRKDGRFRWFLTRGEPHLDDEGRVTEWYGSCTDVHERRLAEDRLRLLMAELQHRVKNILAVVRSIFGRTIETNDLLEDAADHFMGRIDALARTQSVLVRTPEDGVDLEELIREELLVHDDDGARVAIAGPSVRLRAAAAEAMGLVVHELTTNATKYGALSTSAGHLQISWRVHDSGSGPRLIWEWQESGVPVVDPAPTRVGFGRQLIEQGLAYQLGGSAALEFTAGGVRCRIELPLTSRVIAEMEENAIESEA